MNNGTAQAEGCPTCWLETYIVVSDPVDEMVKIKEQQHSHHDRPEVERREEMPAHEVREYLDRISYETD